MLLNTAVYPEGVGALTAATEMTALAKKALTVSGVMVGPAPRVEVAPPVHTVAVEVAVPLNTTEDEVEVFRAVEEVVELENCLATRPWSWYGEAAARIAKTGRRIVYMVVFFKRV